MQLSGSAITRRRLLGTAAGSGSQTGCAQRRARPHVAAGRL